ncbi:hypothetical protein Efla_005237 [Eimeria flavescens]
MRDAFRGRGRGRGGGSWRGGAQRLPVVDAAQQQWKAGPGLVPGLETRHVNQREVRLRPEREAEPPQGPLPLHAQQPPHRRRQQIQGVRRERAVPYEQRSSLGSLPPGGGRGVLGRAYNEVCKLLRLTEGATAAAAAPSSPVFSPVLHGGSGPPAAAAGGVRLEAPGTGQQLNGAVPQHSSLEADDMSEVSQAEEGEVEEDGPGSSSTTTAGFFQASSGPSMQQEPTAASMLNRGNHAAAADQQRAAAADSLQLKALQHPVSTSPPAPQQQQQQVVGTNVARRDPRLAARARAEASNQKQSDAPNDALPQQPDSPDSPQPSSPETAASQQQQNTIQQLQPSDLPPSLRREPLLSGKLPLLLDLDNTLLHAQAVGVAGYHIALDDWLDEDGLPEVYRFELPCNRKVYYLKLRPGLRRFLRALAPLFELSIYTNATQEYADLVVAILDPDRSLFGDRIVARESSGRGEQSENKTVRCLYGDLDRRCVVAFDDRQNIWTDLPVAHVVKAQHYDFFDSSRPELLAHYPHLPVEETMAAAVENPRQRATALEKPSPVPLSKKHLSRPYDWDRHMHHMVPIFVQVHQEFFKDPWNANVGSIISAFQSRALAGVGLFLTGYRKSFAPGSLVADCEERQAELAQRLGATVHRRYDEPGVTHVMAGKSNTNNMLALKERSFQHLKKVHTLWLFSCESIWGKAPESCFDADALCALYDNQPPCAPFKDHWMHLADFAPPPVAAPAQPLPLKDRLPVKEFLGTGPYSDGATLISPFEETIFFWRPEKQPIRQLYAKIPPALPQALTADSTTKQQQLLAAAIQQSQQTAQKGKGNDMPSTRTDRQDGEVMPFCNYQAYAV